MESLNNISKALPFYDKPLPNNHIRLLELVHEEGESLRCTLRAVDLATTSLYNALSYTLGDPRPEISQEPGFDDLQHVIYVNGYTTTIGTNLYNVLMRSRSGCPATYVPIWVDALCINQMDAAEKSIQVKNMDQVYKNANAVFAWLGEADDYAIAGFTAIEKLAALDRDINGDYASHRLRELSDHGFDEWDWTSLVAVFRRAWFLRVWVIQEVYLAQRIAIVCGDQMLSGDTLGLAVTYLIQTALWQKILPYRMMFTPHEHRHAGGQGIEALGGVMWALQQFDAPLERRILSPKAITLFGRGAKAKDLRDHVYAMRGLAKEAILLSGTKDLELPDVNYEDSVRVDEAFLGWTKFMIEEVEDYLLFSMVEDRSHRAIISLPSWVPDISVSMMPVTLRRVEGRSSWKPFGANSDGWILYTDDPLTIEVPAANFDSITAVTKEFDSFNGTQDYVSILEFIEPLTAATSPFASIVGTAAVSPYSNPLEALARAVTTDSSTSAEQSQSLPSNLLCWLMTRIVSIKGDTQAMFAPLLRMAARNYAVRQTMGRLSAELTNPGRMLEVQAFEIRSSRLRNCRRLVRTRRNYLGIAGISASAGDEIWILPNSITPFVMREQINGKYELVGEAYVEGIMNGEVASTLKWREIQIS
jgi:hypothetical protein